MKGFIYFSAEWCQPCKALGPIMEQVAKQVPVNKVNVDYDVSLTKQYNVTSVPTVVLVDNGVEKSRFTGVKPINDIVNFYNNN
jgi:thioredoxin 1